MQIVTYLINLDTSTSRLREATGQLNAQKIAFERIPAFDGRELNIESIKDYDARAAWSYMGRPLKGGEIGCYFSHLDCAKRFLESDADYALVLEDDTTLAKDIMLYIRQMLDWLAANNIAWDVINVGAKHNKHFSDLQKFGSHTLVSAHYFPMSTAGIIWSRTGAQRFTQGYGTIFAPIDCAFREWQSVAGRGLSVMPPLVITTANQSEIDTGTASRSQDELGLLYWLRKQRRMYRCKLRAARHKRGWRKVANRAE